MRSARQKLQSTQGLPTNGSAKPLSLDDIKKLANDSSAKNRNFYIAYLALSFYVLVMALGISDKELLLDQRQLPIPLLSLGLKPTIWFWVAPGVLSVMYLDVILNLREHLRKLVAWRTSCGGELPPQEVQPFLVDFSFAHRRNGFWGLIYHAMLRASAALLGPFALIACLVKFGAYQSVVISGYHLLLVLISLLLAAYFMHVWRLAITAERSMPTTTVQMLYGILFNLTNWFVVVLMLAAVGYGLMIERYASGKRPTISKNFLFEPRLQVANAVLVSIDASEKQALEILQARQSGITVTNLTTSGKANSLADMWWEYGAKLDLSERHFNYADLSGSLLPRAIFTNSQLKEVKLFDAQLQGAEFGFAQLQGASLRRAQLQGANLVQAQLQKTELSSAQLQGASLAGAQLQRANLDQAQLREADLSQAQLQGANLEGAKLQGARLFRAQLQGARMGGAVLHGSLLINAQLQGADMEWAQLQGANLSGAQLQGANLVNAQLQGALLHRAQIQGADLRRAQLQGVHCDDLPFSSQLETGKTNLSGCNSSHWLINDAAMAAKLVNELGAQIADQSRSQLVTQRIQQRVGKPIWQEALCANLTTKMVDAFKQHKHQLKGLPLDIFWEWQSATKPCPEPGKPAQ